MAANASIEGTHVLNLTRQQYLDLSLNSYETVVVGIATFRKLDNGALTILILKRAPQEQHYPNHFELSGGNVDAGDSDIRVAVQRELAEETTLTRERVVHRLPDMSYGLEKNGITKSANQLNFVISVHDGEVKTHALEHSESRWAKEKDIEDLKMNREMRELIKLAFDWAYGTLLQSTSAYSD